MEISNNKIPWKFIIILFILLRLITLVTFFISSNFLEYKDTFAYKNPEISRYLTMWANFDGVHYIKIAQDTYKSASGIQAFFPGYVIAIRLINTLINNYLYSGLLISHLFFILSLAIFYRLILLDFNPPVAKKSLILLTFFPTSFYFLSVYTESLYLFLTLVFFYLIRKNTDIKSSLVGGITSAVRITGIFLFPAAICEIYLANKNKLPEFFKLIKKYWYIILISFGLFSYMLYLKINFNDPLLFTHVQSGFGAGRQTDKFILLYQVIWRYLKMFVTVDRNNPIYFTIWLEFITTISFLGLLIWGYFKKIRLSYLIYGILCLLLPTLTGTFSSMPRYVLIIFPVFLILATINNKFIRYLILTFNIILLVICTALFTQGYWVA